MKARISSIAGEIPAPERTRTSSASLGSVLHALQRAFLALFAGRSRIVLIAMGADLLVAMLKFAVARQTGSSAIYAEALHSLMDAATEVALLYGLAAARRPATVRHQLGYGREVYFWSFVAALMIFAGGAGSAVHDGLAQIMNPQPIRQVSLSYAVLLISLVIEVLSTAYALTHAAGTRSPRGWLGFIANDGDSSSSTVLLGGLAAIVGLALAAGGLGLGLALDKPALDGVASLGIAVVLALTALVLAAQGRSLLIGRAASAAKSRSIVSLAATIPGVEAVNGAITVRLSPEQLLVALSVVFDPALRAPEIEAVTAAIDAGVKAQHPDVVAIFVKPQSRGRYAHLSAARGW